MRPELTEIGTDRPPTSHLLALSGYLGMQSVSTAATASRPLVYPLGTEPPTLDINLATDTTSHLVLGQLMEGLYHYQADGSIEPAGVITHTISSDGEVYTVTLRSDASWSDGQPVTAQRYVDGIIRLLDSAMGAEYAWRMYLVEGAEEYHTGVITDTDAVGITAVATDTLVLTLKEPAGFFPSLMATSSTYPVRLDIIGSDPDWTEGGHFVGNGPYVLTGWDHGNRLVVEKNPLYHNAAQVSIEGVILPIIPHDQLAAYENDELDVSGIPSDELSRVLADPVLSAEFHNPPRSGVYYLGINTQLAPTYNVSVCKALATAIDRSYILTDVLNMPWREGATSVIPPNIAGYQNGAVGYTFNLTQAQTYLAQAGYPDGDGFPEIELWANYGNEGTIEAVAGQWRNNLRITVTTVYTGWDSYLEYLDGCTSNPGACPYNAYRQGWVMDYGDANNILNEVFHPDSPFQYTGWDNARYRELIGMTLTETNQVSRTAYFQEADRILVEEETAVIPLYFTDRTVLVKSDLTFEYPPFGSPHFAKWGITTVAVDTVSTTGGSLSSPDGDISVEFPDGAVTEPVVVTYTALYLPSSPPPAMFAFTGNAFTLEAAYVSSSQEVTAFEKPVTITINYTEGDLNGKDENTLELQYWDGSGWVTDGISIVDRDTINNHLVVTIEHLAEFALFGQHRLYLPLVAKNFALQLQVGLVTGVGGVDDRGFTASAWAGVQRAIEELGVEGQYLESQEPSDYAPNINQFIQQGYDLIVTVGFLLGDTTKTAAEANPDTDFTIVDFSYDPPLDNVRGLTFATDEAAFLAGYLAAAMTHSGKVGTFGGLDIPPVTIFMVGLENGVEHYNEQHSTSVEVLGAGLFIDSFESTEDGRIAAESLMDEGADIIMPVAGPAGLGAAEACQERGTMMIGVDTDWYISAPEYQEIYLTSALKGIDNAVFQAIKDKLQSTFTGGEWIGTLENDGVGIAPFHEYEDEVPQAVKDEMEGVRQGIIEGTIDTGWPSE